MTNHLVEDLGLDLTATRQRWCFGRVGMYAAQPVSPFPFDDSSTRSIGSRPSSPPSLWCVSDGIATDGIDGHRPATTVILKVSHNNWKEEGKKEARG